MIEGTVTPAARVAETGESPPPHLVRNRRDDHSYEELSHINNELVNLQRELARTNAELAAAHEKLEVSEERYRNLNSYLPVGILEFDAAGRCVYANPQWQAITGLTADESLGDGWQRALASGNASAYREEWNRARRVNLDFKREFCCLTPHNGLRWADFCLRSISTGQGRVSGHICMVADITDRKMAELNLRKLSRAVEQSPVSIVITDLQGRIEYVNPKFYAVTGYSFDEVRGKNPRLLKSGEMPLEAYRQLWATITAGVEWQGEFHNRRKNGELYWESASISPIRGEMGEITHFVAVKEDITQRKRALASLLESQQRLELATGSAHIGIWDWDLVSNQKVWDAQMHGLYGIREQDYDGSFAAWQKRLHSDDRDRVVADIQNALAGSKNYHTEFRIVWPSGEVRYLEAHGVAHRADDGSALRMIGVNWDITGRKQAEQNLRESEEKLSKIFQSSPVAISLSTVCEGRLLDVNGEYLRMVERTREEVLGRTSHELGLWLDPAQRAGVLNQLSQQSSLRNIELDLRAKSGRVHHVLWSSEILVIQGEPCLLGSALDITERKRAQVEREKLERELAEHKANEEIARLALEHEQKSSQIKSRFVSMVSHEFRTPLSVINMAAELLDGYWDKMTGEERSEQLTNIRSSVERMTQMMNDFLVYGNCANRTTECKPAWVKVEALCRRLIAEVPNYPGSPPTIECTVDSAVEGAWLDEKILRHILGNLLSNAVKYSSNDQPVKLEVKRVVGNPEPEGGTGTETESHLEFKVSDSGLGIPAADLAKLCQTFHRAANVGNRPGTGMGLAIVKQFVDVHRGTIRFESQEGKGTIVWVRLPTTSPASPAVR